MYSMLNRGAHFWKKVRRIELADQEVLEGLRLSLKESMK